MNASSAPFATYRFSPPQLMIAGGLVAGALDLLYAFVFWGFQGVSPVRILHAIASGWVGRTAAVAGGNATAALGAVSHFLIAVAMAFAYYLVARQVPALTRRPWLLGSAYGVFLYFFMQWVVLPLSAAGSGGPTPPLVMWTGLAAHAFLVGVPIALFVRAALRRR